MSTRSVLAVQTGDTWKGRYCHSNGYPTFQARELISLVQRDGVETVRKVLTEDHAGWSQISADRPDITGVRISSSADHTTYPYGSPKYAAWEFRGQRGIYRDGRYLNVPGYGVAYSTKVFKNFHGQRNYQQVSPDEWVTSEYYADTDCEWAYVLGDKDLLVFRPTQTEWELVRRLGYDTDPDDAKLLRAVECGEQFERCGHIASYHFPEAKEYRTSVGTQVWLGHSKPGYHDITKVIEVSSGREFVLTGGGCSGSAKGPQLRYDPFSPTPKYWWASVADGADIRLGRQLGDGKFELDPEYAAVVPTARGELVINAGTVLGRD